MKKWYIGTSIVIGCLLLALFDFQFSPNQRFTLFFINKAVASTGIVLIGLSYLWGPLIKIVPFLRPHKMLRKYFGLVGFGVIILHIITSLMQFEGRIKFEWYTSHWIGFFGGLVAILLFLKLTLISNDAAYLKLGRKKWQFIQRLGYLALVLTLIHIYIAGGARWQMWLKGEVAMPLSAKIAVFIGVVFVFRLISMVLDKIFPKKK